MEWMFENKKEFLKETDFGDFRILGSEELSENIKKFGNNKQLNKLANAYYAVPACNGFTLAGKMITTGHEYGSGGAWHRDSYLRQFKSLIYLNDVTEDNGPFQVIIDSHKAEQIKLDKKIASLDEMQSTFPPETVNNVFVNSTGLEDIDITGVDLNYTTSFGEGEPKKQLLDITPLKSPVINDALPPCVVV